MRAALLGMAFALALAAQSFPVAGVVVDAVNGSPLKRARVTLSGPNIHEQALITGEDGRFAFNVPRGKYALNAEYRGVRQLFGEPPGTGLSIGVYTGPDQHTSNLVFRWVPQGAISGIVIDDRGEPAQSVRVQLIRASVFLGRKRFVSAGSTNTNDLGEYRFGPLVAGTYYLVATGEPWYASRIQPLRRPGDPPETENEPSPAYAPAYYPNSADLSGASPLTLAPDAEVTANFTLQTIYGVNLRVHAPAATGAAGRVFRLSLMAEGPEGVRTFQRQSFVDGGGSQTIAGVPPGRYVIQLASTSGAPLSAQKTVDIGGADMDVELQPQPAAIVSGKIVFPSQEANPGPVYISFLPDSGRNATGVPVNSKGLFSATGLSTGKNWLRLGSRDGFFISQITAGGTPVPDDLIDVADGASIQLNITASGEVGRLKGFVTKAAEPVAGVLAVLAPRQESSNPYKYLGYLTDNDGSFDFEQVAAGDYILFAVNRGDFEFANPAAVRPYLASGKAVHITAHSVSTERISISPIAAQ